MASRTQANSIDEYLKQHPSSIVEKLEALRAIIREEAPGATEKISYAIPTFYLKGNLVHFAAYSHHIGFYPGAKGIETFQEELKGYHSAKGSVQFPLSEPLPEALIRRIVRFRVKDNLEKAASKPRKGSSRREPNMGPSSPDKKAPSAR